MPQSVLRRPGGWLVRMSNKQEGLVDGSRGSGRSTGPPRARIDKNAEEMKVTLMIILVLATFVGDRES